MRMVGLMVGLAALFASSASAHPYGPYCDPNLFDKLEPWQRDYYLKIAIETVDAGVEFFGKQTPVLFKQHCEEKGGKYRPDDSLHHCFFPSGMRVTSRIYRKSESRGTPSAPGRVSYRDEYQYTVVYPNMITAEYYEAAKRVLVQRFGEPNFKSCKPDADPLVWDWRDAKCSDGTHHDWDRPFKIRAGSSGVKIYVRDVGPANMCPFSIEEVYECL